MKAPRDARLFTADGVEVFITFRCYKCGETKPLDAFGLRRMGDGKIRSIPWCRKCRSASGRTWLVWETECAEEGSTEVRASSKDAAIRKYVEDCCGEGESFDLDDYAACRLTPAIAAERRKS